MFACETQKCQALITWNYIYWSILSENMVKQKKTTDRYLHVWLTISGMTKLDTIANISKGLSG
ncbi:hypothetical protein BLOT_007762 [Blomia tropicalis]|nr:hypothetical protein BLOT_007762 [Blomia tropicalis]